MRHFFKSLGELTQRRSKETDSRESSKESSKEIGQKNESQKNESVKSKSPPRRRSSNFLENLRRRSQNGDGINSNENVVIKNKLVVLATKSSYLEIAEGQKLIIMETENLEKGMFIVSVDSIVMFKVPCIIFNLSSKSIQNASNIYLKALDILQDYDEILFKLLNTNPTPAIAKLMGNYDILSQMLSNLININETSGVNSINTIKVHPAITLAAMLINNEQMIIFRNSYINYLISLIIEDKPNKASLYSIDTYLNNVIRESLNYLIEVVDGFLPTELNIIIKAFNTNEKDGLKYIVSFIFDLYISSGLSQCLNEIYNKNNTMECLPDALSPRQLSPSRKIALALKNPKVTTVLTLIQKIFKDPNFHNITRNTVNNNNHNHKNNSNNEIKEKLILFIIKVLKQPDEHLYTKDPMTLEACDLYLDILRIGRHYQYDTPLHQDPDFRNINTAASFKNNFRLRIDLDKLEDEFGLLYDDQKINRIRNYLTKQIA